MYIDVVYECMCIRLIVYIVLFVYFGEVPYA